MRENRKIAIVLSGGGTRCAYSAGALVALSQEYGFETPSIAIASSGSVASLFYFLAGQHEDIKKTWTGLLDDPLFISFRKRHIMDIDYLIDHISKKKVPLDVAKLDNTKTKWFIPLTEARTGKTFWATKICWFDVYEIMRAAKAIPILYNERVRLGGGQYLDGDFSTTHASLLRKAIDEGATTIISVTNNLPPSLLARILLGLYAIFSPRGLRKIIFKDLFNTEDFTPEETLTLIPIAPSKPLPMSVYSHDKRELNRAFELGYTDMLINDDIRALFGNPTSAKKASASKKKES